MGEVQGAPRGAVWAGDGAASMGEAKGAPVEAVVGRERERMERMRCVFTETRLLPPPLGLLQSL